MCAKEHINHVRFTRFTALRIKNMTDADQNAKTDVDKCKEKSANKTLLQSFIY